MSQPAPANDASAKCPIRYMDQHSPEEIAHYVETHKHQIPRSHELCVRRYQKNEDQIKKLDAKYGNLAGMIKDLGKVHQPMLPSAGAEAEAENEVDGASNERVENWAHEVSASAAVDPDRTQTVAPDDDDDVEDPDRQSHFHRPLKEVRVGESPSRPWGISVPAYDAASSASQENRRPTSPPPAPVRMPTPSISEASKAPETGLRKCPFDHAKLSYHAADPSLSPKKGGRALRARLSKRSRLKARHLHSAPQHSSTIACEAGPASRPADAIHWPLCLSDTPWSKPYSLCSIFRVNNELPCTT